MNGALIKLQAILVVEMSDEYYQNIGGYTDEHLNYILNRIFPNWYIRTLRKQELFTIDVYFTLP
jgi:hypothetical protein